MLDKYGRAAIARVVADFYGEVLQSPLLSPYFEEASVGQLVEHQSLFMAGVMGGPKVFTPDQIRQAHHHLHIDHRAFEEMLDLLETKLRQHGFADEDIDQVLERYRAMEDQVVAHRET